MFLKCCRDGKGVCVRVSSALHDTFNISDFCVFEREREREIQMGSDILIGPVKIKRILDQRVAGITRPHLHSCNCL